MIRLLPNVSNKLRYWWLRRMEPWLGPDQTVASAKQNRSGFFPPSDVPSSRKGKGKGKVKGKSKDSSCLICGRSNDIRKDLAKEVKMDLARFIWELLGVLILNCLRQWCFQADVVLDGGATETAGGVEAVQILVDAVKQGFLILAL